jgi:3-oxosteroid 1-dehydrogenase
VALLSFYAVRVEPCTLGSAAGLNTYADARVLGANGDAMAGLYACGNDMTSMMQGLDPGPGITLGPAVAFAYRAVMHVLLQQRGLSTGTGESAAQ